MHLFLKEPPTMTSDTRWGRDQIQFGPLYFRGECTLRPDEETTLAEWEITINLAEWKPENLPRPGAVGYLTIAGREEWPTPVFVQGLDALPAGKARLRIGSFPEHPIPSH
jgi:hypothetical protein